MRIAVLFLAACAAEQGNGKAALCTTVESSVDDVAPPAQEAEVWGQIETYSPVEVRWERTSGEETSPLSVVATRGEGDATTVEYTGAGPPSCREGAALHIPVTFALDISEGDATATLSGFVDAFGLSNEDMAFKGYDVFGGEASISADWASQASGSGEAGGEITEWWVDMSGSFADSNLTIVGGWESADDSGTGAFWDGQIVSP
jgi:hypothetical protein